MSFLSHLPARLAFVALVAATPLAFSSAPAQAIVCANGVYHAGCAGPNGAVGVRKVAPVYAHPVAPYARTCVWRNGVKICR